MTNTAIILGAKGRFGRAARDAFLAKGWTVRLFARSWPEDIPGTAQITGDALDPVGLAKACDGADVIVHALHPANYATWEEELPKLTQAVLAAAKASGALTLVPGNVYCFGEDTSQVWSETTPKHPLTRNGQLRVEMENAFEASGLPVLILRGGDFIEAQKTGNWFDSHMTTQLAKGKVTYPGPLDRMHAWAYLPDMARAMADLAERNVNQSGFLSVAFDGYSLTGAELVSALERATGGALKVSTFPWPILRVLGLFSANMRGVLEMRYLWNTPHQLDGTQLAELLPDFEPTPLDEAIADAIGAKPRGDIRPRFAPAPATGAV